MSKHEIVAHGVRCFKPSHPEMKRITDEHGGASLHGTKVWDASFVLMDFLSIDGIPKGTKVLDIGCGWGPLTCYLKKSLKLNVLSIDADESVEPYLNFHAVENDITPHFWPAKIHQLKHDDLAIADIIMGGDICFWESLRDDWKKLFKRAKKAGVKQIFLSDPGRSPFNELVDWAADRFDCQLWEHTIKKPVKSSHFILEVNF